MQRRGTGGGQGRQQTIRDPSKRPVGTSTPPPLWPSSLVFYESAAPSYVYRNMNSRSGALRTAEAREGPTQSRANK